MTEPFFSILLDRFLLRSVEEKVAKRTSGVQERIALMHGAGTARVSAAEAQNDERMLASTLDLQRAGVTLFAGAALLDKGEEVETARPAIWAKVDALGDIPALSGVLDFLRANDMLAADALPLDAQLKTRDDLREVGKALRSRVEPRSAHEIRVARRVRIALVAIGAAVIVGWVLRSCLRPTNYALGATVTMSSQYPGTPAPEGLVNGEIEGKYGAHTRDQDNPWIVVDLGKPRFIRETRVYNRGDEWARESLPLDLSLSNDGVQYDLVETRATPFSQTDPWVTHPQRMARFVKLSKSPHGYVALSELEVY